MLEELKKVIEYKEFLRQFTAQQLKTRYSGSVLGFVWTLLNPVLSCTAFALVFSAINRWNLRTTGLYFFAGYIPWFFFVNATTAATFSIIGNAQYVTRIYVPRIIFPLATLLVNLADLLAGMLVVMAYMIIFGTGFSPALAILPVAIVLIWMFALGVGFLFATVNVFLRDFQFLWMSVSFLWFFFTPIIYAITDLPENVRPYFEANPVLPFIRMFQQPICHGVLPSIETFGLALLYSVTVLTVGVTAFSRSERSFYLYI
jgi:lipopolysaccharide transport system permease protein